MATSRREAIASASRWIVRSRIQIDNPRSPAYGAFNAWYDLEKRRFAYVYPEITGYGITALLYLHSLTPRPELLERARRAGDLVLRRAIHACGGIRPRDYYEREDRSTLFSFERHLLVVFDSGIVLFGLTNLFQATRSPAYLRAARRIADFLILKAQKPNGLFHACLDIRRGTWIDRPDKWSAQSGSYHAKLALGLLDLHRLTGETAYVRGAIKICRAALKLQRPSGRYPSYRGNGSTHLHPHLYSAEGVLAAGLHLNNSSFIRSAARAMSWILSQQLADGGLPCLVGEPGFLNSNQRSDVMAQALRLGSICHGLGLLPSSALKAMSRLESRMMDFQRKSAPQKGGFGYGHEMNGEFRRHVNFWCTAFALQALAMRREALERRSPAFDLFI